jgi:hypothetical protein
MVSQQAFQAHLLLTQAVEAAEQVHQVTHQVQVELAVAVLVAPATQTE